MRMRPRRASGEHGATATRPARQPATVSTRLLGRGHRRAAAPLRPRPRSLPVQPADLLPPLPPLRTRFGPRCPWLLAGPDPALRGAPSRHRLGEGSPGSCLPSADVAPRSHVCELPWESRALRSPRPASPGSRPRERWPREEAVAGLPASGGSASPGVGGSLTGLQGLSLLPLSAFAVVFCKTPPRWNRNKYQPCLLYFFTLCPLPATLLPGCAAAPRLYALWAGMVLPSPKHCTRCHGV